MAEDIRIEINLDDGNIEETFQNIEQVAKQSADEIQKAFGTEVTDKINGVAKATNRLIDSTFSLKGILESTTGIFLGFSAVVGEFGGELSKVFLAVTNQFVGLSKGIFGLTVGLSAASGGFDILTDVLRGLDSEVAKTISAFTALAGLIVGGLSFALTFLIIKIGELAFNVGTKLVTAFDKASQVFAKFEREALLFNKTIDAFNKATDGAVGSTDRWTGQISKLRDELNLSERSLQKSAREIVSVGSRLKLSEDQLIKLNRVVAEFAKLQGKDVVQTSAQFVGALNGASQGVVSFGLKLNESANQAFLLKQGIDKQFSSLVDAEKVQIRFNNLLSQYKTVAGLAASTAETLADQQEKLTINQERLNKVLGRGAALIEKNNIVAFGLNKVLDNVNESVISAVGFLGALGARFLQIGGFLLTFSFQILAVTKAFTLLNIALKTITAQTLLATNLPLLNKSLNVLVANLAGTTVALTSVGNVLKAIGLISLKSLKSLPGLLLNIGRAALTALIPFLPLIAELLLIAGIIVLVVKAFQKLEEEIGFFSEAFAIFKKLFNFDGLSIFADLLNDVTATLVTLATKGIGVVIVGFAKLFQLFNAIAQSGIGKKLFGDSQFRIFQLNQRLQGLSDRLIAAGFDFRTFASTLGSSGKAAANELAGIIANLKALDDEIKKITGATPEGQLQALRDQLAARQGVLREAFENALIDRAGFNERMGVLQKSFAKQEEDLLLQSGNRQALIRKSIGDATMKLFTGVVSQGVAEFGKALAQGENGLEAFGKTILSLLGDFFIQIGTSIVVAGQAIESLKAALTTFFGGFAVIGGLALIAIGGALKGFAGGPSGASATTPTGAAQTVAAAEPVADQDALEDLDKSTAVTVNVEGTILNPIDTGRQIADLLDEAFNAGASTVDVMTA